jgi:hypothetical protein
MPPTMSAGDLISDQDEVEEGVQGALRLGQQFTNFAALKAATPRRCVEAQFAVRYQVTNRKANIVGCLSGAEPLSRLTSWVDLRGGAMTERWQSLSGNGRSLGRSWIPLRKLLSSSPTQWFQKWKSSVLNLRIRYG